MAWQNGESYKVLSSSAIAPGLSDAVGRSLECSFKIDHSARVLSKTIYHNGNKAVAPNRVWTTYVDYSGPLSKHVDHVDQSDPHISISLGNATIF